MNTMSSEAVAPVIRAVAGAVVGRAHRRLGRPCQDAWALAQTDAIAVAVVCDGCGSGARSEVGAAIGARMIAHAVTSVDAALDDESTWLAIRDRVLAQLAPLVAAMGQDPVAVVREHFLFTVLCAAFTADHAIVMAIGDGVFAIDDDLRQLGPFADNQPPYLGYGLVGAAPALTAFEVRAASSVRSLLVATDGADGLTAEAVDAAGEPIGDVTQFMTGDRWFANPDALRRRLTIINREDTAIDHARGAIVRRGAPLDDDTAIAVLRRTP